MNRPVFSIIVPVYNAAATLEATVQSVLAQSFADFELILIDDGSSDHSLSIMQELASLDDRIKATSWSNKGVSATRNFGVGLCQGQLIAFLDADDLWQADKLEQHYRLHANNTDIGASYAKIAFIAPDAVGCDNARTTSDIVKHRLSVADLLGENPVCTMSNLVVRSDQFDAIGKFDESMSFAEDQEWLARAANANCCIMGIDEVLVGYRLSEDGLSVDLNKMYAGWRALACEYQQTEKLVSAEAVYCRYLARRALRSGAPSKHAVHFAIRGLQLDAGAFLADARRGWLTLLSVFISPFIPRFARLRVFA
jgi:glycosyltransferase involved in cell wall biosynthesis